MTPQEGKMAGVSRPATISTKQMRIATLARQMPDQALFSLSHHIDLEWLREAYRRTRKSGAAGIDGVTAQVFEQGLEDNLQELLEGLKSGRYRAPAVRRVEIPKGRGETRPIGIPTLSDKVLQRAVHMALTPLYEEDFYDFSYGFRPGRSARDAVDALQQALFDCGRTCWVLEVDVRSFFDTIDHGALRDLLKQRVADGVIVRAVGKWLRAGIMCDGVVHNPRRGTPQGGVISPLLANIYLHHVVDEWWATQVVPRLRGKAWMVRYADDFVMVFAHQHDAQRVQAVLPKRLARFGLSLHPEKTRLIKFKPPPSKGGGRHQGGGFDFLGFTFYPRRSHRGFWIPAVKTSSSTFSRVIRRLDEWMRRHRHLPVAVQWRVLSQKLRGILRYFERPYNWRSCWRIRWEAAVRWIKWLRRRSQHHRLDWRRANLLLERYPLPRPRRATVQGRLGFS